MAKDTSNRVAPAQRDKTSVKVKARKKSSEVKDIKNKLEVTLSYFSQNEEKMKRHVVSDENCWKEWLDRAIEDIMPGHELNVGLEVKPEEFYEDVSKYLSKKLGWEEFEEKAEDIEKNLTESERFLEILIRNNGVERYVSWSDNGDGPWQHLIAELLIGKKVKILDLEVRPEMFYMDVCDYLEEHGFNLPPEPKPPKPKKIRDKYFFTKLIGGIFSVAFGLLVGWITAIGIHPTFFADSIISVTTSAWLLGLSALAFGLCLTAFKASRHIKGGDQDGRKTNRAADSC